MYTMMNGNPHTQSHVQQNPYVLNKVPGPRDAKKEEILHQYSDFLMELTFNSRNHINVLTTEAQNNMEYYADIVKIIENRVQKVCVCTCPELAALFFISSGGSGNGRHRHLLLEITEFATIAPCERTKRVEQTLDISLSPLLSSFEKWTL